MHTPALPPSRKRFTVAVLLIGGFVFAAFGVVSYLTGPANAEDAKIATITADGLAKRLSDKGEKPLVVDVREQNEYDEVHIDGVMLAPMATVEAALEKTAKDREIVLVCRSGRRSGKAWQALSAKGFTNMKNLEGGMLAWEKLGYPVVRKKQ